MNPLGPVAPLVTTSTHEWHLALQAPWGRAALASGIVCAAIVIGLALVGARGERRAGRRLSLAVLRIGGVLAALVLFLQPAIEFEDVTRVPNHVAVLVDASESMTLAERAGQPSRAVRVARLLASSAPLFESWRSEHRLDFYTFGGELAPATEEALADEKHAAPTATATRVGEALTALKLRYEGRDLGGVVLLSDGIDNGRLSSAQSSEGEDKGSPRPAESPAGKTRGAEELDAGALDSLRSLGVPVHTVWTGREGLRDISVARVLADDFAFARNAVKVEAVIRTVGASGAGWVGRTLPVVLRRDGVVVKTENLTVDADRPEQKVSFEFTPDRVGKYLYEVSTPVQEGEAIAENNARVFLLKVIRDKIRVLQVAGRPSWDERFLRGLLKRDPNVDLISFFILRTPSDIENVSPDEMSLIPFPTEELFLEQLRSFDVVFLQNFNYGPYGIGAYLNEIKKYVEEGGGLVMLGGDLSFSSGGYARSPVADVLPVELLDEAPPERLVSLDPFRLRLTPEGKNHPIMALRLGGADNLRRWEALPSLEGTNLVARARPGATVLGVHPFLRGVDNRMLPVLAVADIGKGRSMSLTSDSTWRWGFGSAQGSPEGGSKGDGGEADLRGRAYQKFWESSIRWLIKDPELRFLRVETDQPEYGRTDKIRIIVRARETDYRPARQAQVSLALARSGAATMPGGKAVSPVEGTQKTLKTDDEGEAELEIGPLPPGGYRVTARRVTSGGAAVQAAHQDEEVFLVRGAGRELEDPEARSGLLRAVASATGGSFKGPDADLGGLRFAPPRVVRVNRYRDLELWSTWMTLLAAALFLSAEWALRRRWGLP